MKYENDKLMRKYRNEQTYLNIKNTLKQKYDDVKVDARYNIDTGKAYSKIILSKNGEKFVSEITKDYGNFDASKQIEFKQMFED